MKNQKGTTLIEVLVAMLIVSIGVLGHAKMQIRSMDIAQQANFSQIANTALLDLSQRMRANSGVVSSFTMNNLSSGNSISSSKDCASESCTNTEFATYEVSEWFTHLQINLPSPRFSVGQAGDLYTLTLIWDAAKTGAGNGVCNTSTANSHQCVSMEVWVP